MQEVSSSNPPVITGICNPSKSWAWHDHSFKLGSKLRFAVQMLQWSLENVIQVNLKHGTIAE